MDQGQAQADGDGREARRRAAMGRTQDHEQEGEGHHHFADQRRGHAIAAGRMIAIAVAGETGMNIEAGMAAGDQIENAGAGDAARTWAMI